MKILKFRNILAGGSLVLGLAMVGCMTSPTPTGPTITVQPTDQTVAYGSAGTFTITATGTGTLKYVWIVNGDTVQNSTTSTLTGTPNATDDGSAVKCVVTDNNGSVTSSTVTLHITGLTSWPDSSVTITAGAQGNATLGSAIDLDSGVVWLSGFANSHQSQIDLVFAYSAYNQTSAVPQLMSPVAAQNAGDVAVATNYDPTQIKDIKFVPVTAKPVNQQAGEEAYNSGTPVDAAAIQNGDMFVVKTTTGKYVFVSVSSLSGTDKYTGTATLVLSIGTI